MSFEHIFQPLKLRHKTLKNRVVFGAHTNNMAVDGVPGDQQIAYYRERAMGGAAMIVVEPMPVHATAVLTRGNFRPDDDSVIPHFRRLTEACHAYGAVMIQQLYHVGAHGDFDNSWMANYSPSGGLSYHDNDGSHAMTHAEIETMIDGFVAAAQRCQKAGFDGVEIWAAYSCLLDQFWSPVTNQRDDQWGGTVENRTRMSREIIRKIRKTCGDDFIIGLSVTDEPDVDAALSRDETVDIVVLHDQEGALDYVTCGSGSYYDFYKLIPSFQYGEQLGLRLASRLKARLTQARVMSESLIRTPEDANAALGSKDTDLVAMVRGQIADPHLVRKAQEGRADDIRGCLSCNQQCWGRRGRDYWISCLINPSAGREHAWGGDRFEKAAQRRKILIVGAGPAGLECARVCAERGHKVILAEASSDLGGQFRLAGLQPRRAQITDLIAWYERQFETLGVEVRYNAYLDEEEIAAFDVDKVVVATGSLPAETGHQRALPHVARLNGIENGNIWSPEDVMGGAARLGQNVIVLDEGGDWRGIGTAWALAEDGVNVTIVTPDAFVAKSLQRSATDFPARRKLATLGVRFYVETAMTKWTGAGAELTCLLTQKSHKLEADSLVLALANTVDMELQNNLSQGGVVYDVIGDALAPRNAAAAIYEGRKIALSI